MQFPTTRFAPPNFDVNLGWIGAINVSNNGPNPIVTPTKKVIR